MCLKKRTEWNHRYTYNSAFPPHSVVQSGVVTNLNPELSILWYITVHMKVLGKLWNSATMKDL